MTKYDIISAIEDIIDGMKFEEIKGVTELGIENALCGLENVITGLKNDED